MGAEPARRGTPAPPEEVAEDTEEKDKRIETSRGHSALSGHQWEQLELENALHGRRIWSRTTRRRNVAIPDLLRMREMFDRENVSEASSDEPL
jgi:hypothetical protein